MAVYGERPPVGLGVLTGACQAVNDVSIGVVPLSWTRRAIFTVRFPRDRH